MKRKLKRIILFLLIVSNVIFGVLPVQAAENSVPRVTFVNAANKEPDLFITKTVENVSEAYPAPEDAEFTFSLKLNNQLVNREEYKVFDANGNEVFNKVMGIKVPFKTDRSGTFTLKAGQTAKFEYVGNGVSYEVQELTLPENFQKIQPAGESATGTVQPTGSKVVFVNLYSDGDKNDETTQFVVQKEVVMPSGYESPGNAEFTFALEIDGAPWKNEIYTVKDTQSGHEVGSGTTDANGCFSLAGGCSAVFDDVPVDVDYKLQEKEVKGWRTVGANTVAGSTVAPVTKEVFRNVFASFAVSKKMEDGSKPEQEFTFVLTNANKELWADATYYLYDTSGELADADQEGQPIVHKTNAAGEFGLKAGQTAVFYGIPSGTIYNVSEKGNPQYIQILPIEASGYSDKVVNDSVEILPFINLMNLRRTLNVTKTLTAVDGIMPLSLSEYSFVISKKNDVTEEFEALAGAVYSVQVGNEVYTYKTDANGEFAIMANETARFSGLEKGTYKVEEIKLTREYTLQNENSQTKDMEDKAVDFMFVNGYRVARIDLELMKVNSSGESLSDAEFMLYMDEAMSNPFSVEPLISDADGKILIPELKTGIYYLKEIKAPEGYQLLKDPLKLEVVYDVEGLNVSIDGKDALNDSAYQATIGEGETGNDLVKINIVNKKAFILPVTGGVGLMGYVMVGLVGMAVLFCVMMTLLKKK